MGGGPALSWPLFTGGWKVSAPPSVFKLTTAGAHAAAQRPNPGGVRPAFSRLFTRETLPIHHPNRELGMFIKH